MAAVLFGAALGAGSARAQSYMAQPTNPLVPQPQSEGQKIDELLRAGKREEALQRSEALIAKEPRNAQARFLRGVILGDLGRTTDAIAVFEQLTQDYPELPEPYNNLAVQLASQGQLDRARDLLLQAIRLQPAYVTAHENLGDLSFALAADAYRHAATLDPANATLKAKLALARDAGTRLRKTR